MYISLMRKDVKYHNCFFNGYDISGNELQTCSEQLYVLLGYSFPKQMPLGFKGTLYKKIHFPSTIFDNVICGRVNTS